jgi:hypothetical protein
LSLQQIQAKLKAPKNQRNTFGNYNYRSCEDILEAVKPLLGEVGATLTISDELQNIGDRYYIRATATLKCGTENTEVTAYAREDESRKGMDGSQITGSASSYARKYALNGLFLIDDTKDADATNDHGKEPPTASKMAHVPPKQDKPSGATDGQIQTIVALAKEVGMVDAMKDIMQSRYSVGKSSELTKQQALDLLEYLREVKKSGNIS